MSLGTKLQNIIDAKGRQITTLFNQSGLLSVPVEFSVTVNQETRSLGTKFYLNDNTYSRGHYFIESDGRYRGMLVANGAGVNSDMGKRTGMLLFHLQLLLVISVDTNIFYLSNFTDDPARAAQGIYSLLEVNTTLGTHGNPRSEFVGLSLADQLQLSEGEMRLVVDANSMKKWEQQMIQLARSVDGKGYPWNPNVEQNMRRFLQMLGKYGYAGGRSKTRKQIRKKKGRNFSQKSTKKSRKKHRKSKVKSKIQKRKNQKLKN